MRNLGPRVARDYADRLEKDSGAATRRVAVQGSGLTAIFDGKRFVFNESAWTAVNLLNVVRRYGLSYFWLRSAPRSLLRSYLRLYELQARPRTLKLQAHYISSGALLELTMNSIHACPQQTALKVCWSQAFMKGLWRFKPPNIRVCAEPGARV